LSNGNINSELTMFLETYPTCKTWDPKSQPILREF
jgi:hypothetical protein